MRAQTPVGVRPASKTVRRTIEVAVLRGTLENCTLDCMRRANLHKGFLQLNFPPVSPEKKFGGTIPKRSERIGLFVPPPSVTLSPSSQRQQTQPSPSPPSRCPSPSLSHQQACPVQPRAHQACKPSSLRPARTSCLSSHTLGCTQPRSCPFPCGKLHPSSRRQFP